MKNSNNPNLIKNKLIIKYDDISTTENKLVIENLTIKNGVKAWNYQCQHPMILALFSKDEENINTIIKGIAGINNVSSGKILINKEDITYQPFGWTRQISYFSFVTASAWNKLFSVQYNFIRTGLKNKTFLTEVNKYNSLLKIKISSCRNTELVLDRDYFKTKVIALIKAFIKETEITRNMLIDEYKTQINEFHQQFANDKFNFTGSINITKALIKKFKAEEENIIANNNLLFYQSLYDRIVSLENLIGDCFCGCVASNKLEKNNLKLKELFYVLKEIIHHLMIKITSARKFIKLTLKICNMRNNHFNEILNEAITYKKLAISRIEIEDKIEQWIDIAEIQRIKFNMKQDFIAMQILPDEMNILINNIKEEIKKFHEKILTNPEIQSSEEYNQKLQKLENQVIVVRDVIGENIKKMFTCLDLLSLLPKKYHNLTNLERRIVLIMQQLVVVSKVLVMENPFDLLTDEDKKKLADYLKILANSLKIIIIFASKNQKDIELLADNIVVIENETAIQQGLVKEVKSKPLSLSFFKSSHQSHLNIFAGTYKTPYLKLANVVIANLPTVTSVPIIAIAANDIIFTLKKPRFTFFKKNIILQGKVKNINNTSDITAYLIFETDENQVIEVFVNDIVNITIGIKGWIVIKKNSIYIFDKETEQLLNTW